MGRGKYSSEQILAILKEQEAGTPVAEANHKGDVLFSP
jgi:hypothetical protein